MTSNQLDYFVTCISYKSGAEAVANPDFVWSDVLDIVSEAAGDGNPVLFVHHIHDGVCEDRTIEALDATLNHLSDNGNTLTSNQRDWVEHHFSIATANHFRSAA